MSTSLVHFVLLVLLVATSSKVCNALSVGFYAQTCPNAEQIVRQAVAKAFATNQGIAAGLIRMHFHDCFVRGCDGSVLLNSTAGKPSEKEAIPNSPSLRGFDVIDAAKTALEAQCPNIVSCADIVAFAARDSANLSGNISYQVPAGRRDGRISNKTEAEQMLPSPFMNATQLIANFAAKNLTATDMVILSGAHSIGVAHCATFTNRLYNLSSGAPQDDPTLSPSYAELLRCKCPANSTLTDPTVISQDIITPNTLDNKYYVGVNNNVGLLTSDHALVTLPSLATVVNQSAANQNTWATRFAAAMVKMGKIQVLEGTQGEIRKICSVVNPTTYSSRSFIKTLRGNPIASS